MNQSLRFSGHRRALVISLVILMGAAGSAASIWATEPVPGRATERVTERVTERTTEGATEPAAEQSEAIMLVATPALRDSLYSASVLVARPIGGGQFLGLILNKPSKVTVAQAFPRHAPSQKVKDLIFVGGPERSNSVFALVNTEESPGQGSVKLAPDLFLVLAGSTVDKVIETDPEHARFLVGAVLWKPGELESEIKRGAWYVEQPDTDTMMRKETKTLWKDLVQRRESRRRAI